ncbi:3-isopropylmalate dehydrogenase [Litorimonas cladophorae]|uniref:3-isopropylmalate dehydrogenase n=1 Tax=Litorimonas cladophorae TaxID=1220491 RepID=A0A918KSN5_9PROT|nr:3-isopropylmalate dehydrogenase [Litorimonas cladophorae]GGX74435.1 3-isopropylmalate dehydrogenase [Litorimonas cladophorae]
MAEIHFTYLPGDGIGPEVGAASIAVLNAVATKFGHSLNIEEHLIGGAAIDAGLKPLPDASFESCQRTGAMLLGAVGGPKWDFLKGAERPELGSLLPLRKNLNLYANIRPCKPYPALIDRAPLKRERLEGVDFVVMRELTGGIYFGDKGRDERGAYDECRYSEAEVRRIAIKAFDLAMTRRKKVTSVDKSNVLETSRLWREAVIDVAKSYPEVELEHLLVDAMTMHMLTNAQSFDVVLTENMFGDILTDEASVLCGSMGVIPSASLSDGGMGMYEPIHGSAPDIAGQGKANPLAMILSAAWMLRLSFGLEAEATAIEDAVSAALEKEQTTGDLGGALSTAQVGAWIAEYVQN